MAVVGASTAFFYHPHQHDADVFSMAHPPPYGGSSSSAYSSTSASAASFSPALGAAPPGALLLLQQQQPHHHLDVSDYFSEEGGPSSEPGSFGTPPPLMPVEPVVPDAGGYNAHPRSAETMVGEEGARTDRIAFRTRSEEEILDDGYKWRKYGKKSVKNSPNPRNYYRCSTEGCNVKKRVQRDRDDPSYVVTTYEGIHNHVSPGTVYYAAQDAASGSFFVSGMHHPGS